MNKSELLTKKYQKNTENQGISVEDSNKLNIIN
jgi:hypothetical protein